jgi:hypothetical protein
MMFLLAVTGIFTSFSGCCLNGCCKCAPSFEEAAAVQGHEMTAVACASPSAPNVLNSKPVFQSSAQRRPHFESLIVCPAAHPRPMPTRLRPTHRLRPIPKQHRRCSTSKISFRVVPWPTPSTNTLELTLSFARISIVIFIFIAKCSSPCIFQLVNSVYLFESCPLPCPSLPPSFPFDPSAPPPPP